MRHEVCRGSLRIGDALSFRDLPHGCGKDGGWSLPEDLADRAPRL
jgi:hypothetical protein